MSSEQQQVIIETGIRGSLGALESRTEAETEAMRDSGRFPFMNNTTEAMLTVVSF